MLFLTIDLDGILRVCLHFQIAHKCLYWWVVESCLYGLLKIVTNYFRRLDQVTRACVLTLACQNTSDVLRCNAGRSRSASHTCNSCHFCILTSHHEVLLHNIAQHRCWCSRCRILRTRQFLLVRELMDKTVDCRMRRACTWFRHGPLIGGCESVYNEASTLKSVVLTCIILKVHLLELFCETPLLNRTKLLTSLVAFTTFSLGCCCEIVEANACWPDSLLSLLIELSGTGLHNIMRRFNFLNFPLRRSTDLKILTVIIGSSHKWMGDNFFQATIDWGDRLFAAGAYLHLRLLSCWNNLVPAVLILVVVEVRSCLIFGCGDHLMRYVLNCRVFWLSKNWVMFIWLRTQRSFIWCGHNGLSCHFASSVHSGIGWALCTFEYFVLGVSFEIHGGVLFS